MIEVALDQIKANAVALTTARLEAVLQETQKDEARFKRILEMRRLQRHLRAGERRQQELANLTLLE